MKEGWFLVGIGLACVAAWGGELVLAERGRAPEPVAGEKMPDCLRRASYDWYLPWEDRSFTADAPAIPTFLRSAVVRFPTVVSR